MFVDPSLLEELGYGLDGEAYEAVWQHPAPGLVAGVDFGSTNDSTVVTVLNHDRTVADEDNFYHKLIVGLSILNLGPGVSFAGEASPLPMNLNLGLQYIYDHDYKLFAGLKKYTAYEGSSYSLGGEIFLLNSIFLRASIIQDINNSIKYNMGLGLDVNYSDYHFLIDYVFLPLEAQDTSTIITLSFKFPIKETEKKDFKKEEENWENLWTSE